MPMFQVPFAVFPRVFHRVEKLWKILLIIKTNRKIIMFSSLNFQRRSWLNFAQLWCDVLTHHPCTIYVYIIQTISVRQYCRWCCPIGLYDAALLPFFLRVTYYVSVTVCIFWMNYIKKKQIAESHKKLESVQKNTIDLFSEYTYIYCYWWVFKWIWSLT